MKVAVLGLGSIGTRHARNLRRLGHEVVGYDPRSSGSAEDWLLAASADEALAQAQAAVVATPTSMHAEHATAALARGTAVLVEKPLASTPAEACRIVQLARERDTLCAVAMNLRFHPGVLALRRLLSQRVLGSIRYAQASAGSDLRTWRPQTDYRMSYSAQASLGGGVVRDSIHELDYLTWLLGPAVSVSAEVAKVSELEIDVEDVAAAVLRLASGAIATVDLTYVDTVYRRGCLLVGADGTARWDWPKGTIELARPDQDIEVIDVTADVGDTYVAELRDFLDAVEHGRTPVTPVQEGAAAVALADAVLRSATEGRRIIL